MHLAKTISYADFFEVKDSNAMTKRFEQDFCASDYERNLGPVPVPPSHSEHKHALSREGVIWSKNIRIGSPQVKGGEVSSQNSFTR